MADHSVGAWDEFIESEASEASVFVLTMLPLKSLVSWMVWSVLFRYAYEFLSS